MNEAAQGLALSYRETGSGPPLLLLHGLFGSAINFNSLAQRLADRFRVLSPDLRNHGASPHDPRMDYPAMAADILALLDRLRVEQVTLVGHSMGGKLAMNLALRWPERVRALVVVDIAPVRYPFRHHAIIDAMQALPVTELHDRREADAKLEASIPVQRVRQFILQNLVQHGTGYRWRVNLRALADNNARIADFPGGDCPFTGRAPVLFVAGELSDYLPPTLHDDVRACFPGAEIATLPGTGHWLHVEKPELFLNTLNGFLNSRPHSSYSVAGGNR